MTSSLLPNFDGRARLFPLPNFVFFPRLMQPLHIFEPRYRQMTADALASDGYLALVLPRPGWEENYAGAPALHRIGVLGRILHSEALADGRYNIMLHGLTRVRIIEEIVHDKLYRLARVEPLAEAPIAEASRRRHWRDLVLHRLPVWFPGSDELRDQFRRLFAKESLSVGTVCDMIAFALPLDAEFKQALLEELDDESRLTQLFAHLDAKDPSEFPPLNIPSPEAGKPKFPQDFSLN